MKSRLLALLFVMGMIMGSCPVMGIYPYSRALWDMLIPGDDPFSILEQSPLAVHKSSDSNPAMARADWKETPTAHIITLDVPGVRKEDIKIEVEDTRVVRICGERKAEEEHWEGERWHRAERTAAGKFCRQFRLPASADLESVKAVLVRGVLRVTVEKVVMEKRRPAKVVDVLEFEQNYGHEIEANKAEL